MPWYRINTPTAFEAASDEEAIAKLDQTVKEIDRAADEESAGYGESVEEHLERWHLPLEKQQADGSWVVIEQRLVWSFREMF